MTHQAAWIKERHAQLTIDSAETPSPGPGELLIKVRAIAFSPLEGKIQKLALIPISYPNILGLSFAGTVEKIGSGVNAFQPGDKVATIRDGSKGGDLRFGAYQQYALAAQETTSKLPDSVSIESAASSVLNMAAITAALSIHMGIDRPSLDDPAESKSSKILIYGGSGSAGGLAVCYARAAGYQVITTSSTKNKDFVQQLGATTIIDHTKPQDTIVNEIQRQGPYDYIFDASGVSDAVDVLGQYMHLTGGGTFYTLDTPDRPLPVDVKRYFAPYSLSFDKPEHHDFRAWFYTEFVPQSLAKGVVIPTRPQWMKGGLTQAQSALDMMMGGRVGGVKLLLDPSES